MFLHQFKWQKLTPEELCQVRMEAMDEVFNLKQLEIDLQNFSKLEQLKHYTKELAIDLYMKSYAYLFDYTEYLKYTYKWIIFNDIKNKKAVVPRPNNWFSSAMRSTPIEKANLMEDEEEKKYNEEQ